MSPQICLLNPGLQNHAGALSHNLGDVIIFDAVREQFAEIWPDFHLDILSTHEELGPAQYEVIRQSDYVIVGGSNLLSSNMNHYNQWKISWRDLFRLRNVILMGVGWWQYQKAPNLYTALLLHGVLSKRYVHSLRDEYTVRKLRGIGIRNTVNTSCPTMWKLSPERLRTVPAERANDVLFMVTDYNLRPDIDRPVAELLFQSYERVFVWPQGSGDEEYLRSFNLPFVFVERSLAGLDRLLEDRTLSLDYIGTRLHGGVRCLQFARRSLILFIDNRAETIANDTKLPALARTDLDGIRDWINRPRPTRIELDQGAIAAWRTQFDE